MRLTAAAGSASEASGLRRAAHTLERRGLIELKKHHNEKGTWLVARRKPDELIPEDLARILGPERVRTALDSYASCSPTQWRRRISGSRDDDRRGEGPDPHDGREEVTELTARFLSI